MNSSPDRFSETFGTYNRRDRDEDGFTEPIFSAAGHICENCLKAVERLSWVEGWEYWGCDECHEEAIQEVAREMAEIRQLELADQDTAETLSLLARSGCTLTETALWIKVIDKEVA